MAKKATNSRRKAEAVMLLFLIVFIATTFSYADRLERAHYKATTATGQVVLQVVAPQNITATNGVSQLHVLTPQEINRRALT